MEHGDHTTYERSVPRRGSCPGGTSQITYHHVSPFGWMGQDNPNAQFGGAAASHEVLAKGEKFEIRHARRRAANFESCTFWDRAIRLQQMAKGYAVFLIDWGIETHQTLSSIRLLPRKFASMAPWAKKIRLLGVRDQAEQALKHRMAQVTMLKRTGCLMSINSSSGEELTARLLLDWELGESPRDMGANWLKLRYLFFYI